MKYKCAICKTSLDECETYEYRGAYACESHFDELQGKRNQERQEIINEENHKTERFRGIDLSDSVIGKANKEILKSDIEIAKKESIRIKKYYNRS